MMSRRILPVLVAAMLAVTTAAPVFASAAHAKNHAVTHTSCKMQMAANSSTSKTTRHEKSRSKTATHHNNKASSTKTTKQEKK